jgi:hypothetical protein
MNIKRNLKIKDMAARNVNGIRGRRERENKAKAESTQQKSDTLADFINECICGGDDNGKKIEALIDVLDTARVIEEEGYGEELADFINRRYAHISIYPVSMCISQERRVSNIDFTLPESIDGDFGDMEIKIETQNEPAVKLYGIGAPWNQLVGRLAGEMDGGSFDHLIDDIKAFGEALDTLPDEFFAWVNENFPEEA